MRGISIHGCIKQRLRAAIAGASALVACLAWSGPSQAADEPVPDKPFTLTADPRYLSERPAPAAATTGNDDWRLVLSLGMWTPAVSGDAGVRRLDADIDWDIGDVLSNLNFAIFPGVEIGKGKWAVIFNGAYAQLKDEAQFSTTGPRGRTITGDADTTLDLYVADLGVGYRLFDISLAKNGGKDMVLSLMPIIGVRYTNIGLKVEPDRVESRSGHEDWWDPYVGGRANLRINNQWAWRTEGTVGGFGVGSDFAWAAQTMLDWRFHKNWELNVGYRAVSWDYDNNDFRWDVTMHGPWIGVSFILD